MRRRVGSEGLARLWRCWRQSHATWHTCTPLAACTATCALQHCTWHNTSRPCDRCFTQHVLVLPVLQSSAACACSGLATVTRLCCCDCCHIFSLEDRTHCSEVDAELACRKPDNLLYLLQSTKWRLLDLGIVARIGANPSTTQHTSRHRRLCTTRARYYNTYILQHSRALALSLCAARRAAARPSTLHVRYMECIDVHVCCRCCALRHCRAAWQWRAADRKLSLVGMSRIASVHACMKASICCAVQWFHWSLEIRKDKSAMQ